MLDLVELLGLWAGVSDGLRSTKGWIDLVIVGRPRPGHPRPFIFAELKSQDGRRETAQIQCASAISRAGGTYRLWRTSDLDDGTIWRELEAIA